jgi:hypothetical protein
MAVPFFIYCVVHSEFEEKNLKTSDQKGIIA